MVKMKEHIWHILLRIMALTDTPLLLQLHAFVRLSASAPQLPPLLLYLPHRLTTKWLISSTIPTTTTTTSSSSSSRSNTAATSYIRICLLVAGEKSSLLLLFVHHHHLYPSLLFTFCLNTITGFSSLSWPPYNKACNWRSNNNENSSSSSNNNHTFILSYTVFSPCKHSTHSNVRLSSSLIIALYKLTLTGACFHFIFLPNHIINLLRLIYLMHSRT